MHHRVLEGLKNIQDAKIELGSSFPLVRVQFVIQKSNYKQIPEVVSLCSSLGVDAINFQPLDLTLEGAPDQETVDSLIGDMKKEDLLDVISDSMSLARERGIATNLPTIFSDFDTVWKKYQLVPVRDDVSNICLMPWTSTYVTVEGDVRPCCSFPVDESMNMGNIFVQPFSEIWNSEKYKEFRRKFKERKRPHLTCQYCIAPTVFRVVKSNIISKHMIFR